VAPLPAAQAASPQRETVGVPVPNGVVQPPVTADAFTVSSLKITPVKATVTAACPAKVWFDATITTEQAVSGSGSLYDGDDNYAIQVKTFTWSMPEGKHTATSSVYLTVTGAPGSTVSGFARIAIAYKIGDNWVYSKMSGPAPYTVHCTPGAPGGYTG
jgi:hypothetical protein